MRKLILAALFVVLGLAVNTASFAAVAATDTGAPKVAATPKEASGQVIKGVIKTINATTNQITVKKDRSKTIVAITVADTSSLKEGMHVKITLKAGTNDQAKNVKVLVHKTKK